MTEREGEGGMAEIVSRLEDTSQTFLKFPEPRDSEQHGVQRDVCPYMLEVNLLEVSE